MHAATERTTEHATKRARCADSGSHVAIGMLERNLVAPGFDSCLKIHFLPRADQRINPGDARDRQRGASAEKLL